jgi:steroid delta-isomerase-like uncharacterized protein
MTTKKAILTAFFEDVWNRGDAPAVERYLAPRYTIHHDPGDPWDGKELDVAAFQERLNVSRAPFPDQRFEIHEMFEEEGGNAVVATWHWTGTHQGDMPGFPASGKTVRMSGMTVYYFEGERIAGHWQVKDALGVFRQLRA